MKTLFMLWLYLFCLLNLGLAFWVGVWEGNYAQGTFNLVLALILGLIIEKEERKESAQALIKTLREGQK